MYYTDDLFSCFEVSVVVLMWFLIMKSNEKEMCTVLPSSGPHVVPSQIVDVGL